MATPIPRSSRDLHAQIQQGLQEIEKFKNTIRGDDLTRYPNVKFDELHKALETLSSDIIGSLRPDKGLPKSEADKITGVTEGAIKRIEEANRALAREDNATKMIATLNEANASLLRLLDLISNATQIRYESAVRDSTRRVSKTEGEQL